MGTAVALMMGLRLICLESDAYPRLDWSTGLLTDEGFYVHSARNVILFGQARQDEFNNALLMPVLHSVQVTVFHLFGVGIVPARLISVASSLLTLLVFFAALRRAFGERVALLGTLLLGLDHTNLLYNRLALMDTPAALPMVGAFYALLRGCGLRADASETPDAPPRFAALWLCACGALLTLAFATRSLSFLLFPAPFLALKGVQVFKTSGIQSGSALPPRPPTLGPEGQNTRISASPHTQSYPLSPILSILIGLAGGLLLYALLWYLPNREALARMNAYYLHHQLLPDSPSHLARIVTRFFFGNDRGMAVYLFRHTPVLFLLALLGLVWWWQRGRLAPLPEGARIGLRFLIAWLLVTWTFHAISGYAPSRYYILFYPALTALAAVTLTRLPDVWAAITRSAPIPVALAGFTTYHLLLTLFVHLKWSAQTAVGGAAIGALVVCVAVRSRWAAIREQSFQALRFPGLRVGASLRPAEQPIQPPISKLETIHVPPHPALYTLVLLWALVNLGWTADWLRGIAYTQRDAGQWLAAHLPPDSVLLGAVAPGLCIHNRFVAVPVIPGLCNDNQPVERYAPTPRYILIFDGGIRERWWVQTYPALVAPARRQQLFPRLVNFPVGIYPAQ
jgi:4-amino-4-deoxy-L-arabinose transferase-like glycosyltransferase